MSDDLLARLREAARCGPLSSGTFTPESVQRGLERMRDASDAGDREWAAMLDSFIQGASDHA